jgi:uncharacterized protein
VKATDKATADATQEAQGRGTDTARQAAAPSAAAGTRAARLGVPARIKDVDVLRGFALLGILLVNARLLSGTPHPSGTGMSADRVVALAVGTAVEMKFYVLFSFLFGYSTALLTRARTPEGSSPTARYLRRLGALVVLGACHAVFLYVGDILATYAVLGLLLFLLRGLKPRTLCIIASALMMSLFLLLLAAGSATVASGPLPSTASADAALAELTAQYSAGPVETVSAHLAQLPAYLTAAALFAPHVLAAMLFGLAAGKAGLLERRRTRARLRRLAVVGLLVGLPGSAFMAVCAYGPLGSEWYLLGRAVGVATAPALTGAYVCLVLALLDSGRHRWIGTLCASAGRMSMTHYLCQSLVLCLVFTGYGLGLYGQVGGAPLLIGCAVVYGLQLRLSGPLLARFGRGPAEALVHRLSAGRG